MNLFLLLIIPLVLANDHFISQHFSGSLTEGHTIEFTGVGPNVGFTIARTEFDQKYEFDIIATSGADQQSMKMTSSEQWINGQFNGRNDIQINLSAGNITHVDIKITLYALDIATDVDETFELTFQPHDNVRFVSLDYVKSTMQPMVKFIASGTKSVFNVNCDHFDGLDLTGHQYGLLEQVKEQLCVINRTTKDEFVDNETFIVQIKPRKTIINIAAAITVVSIIGVSVVAGIIYWFVTTCRKHRRYA